MPLPPLPPEVWFRISTSLQAPDLSSMSQVNKTFHQIATNRSHFQRLLAVPQLPVDDPITAYRRICAFSYPPTPTTLQCPPRADMLCVVEDTLVLLDKPTARLISFPGAHTTNVNDLVGNAARSRGGRLKLSLIRKNLAVLPGARIAFLKGSDPTTLTVLDVRTWESAQYMIPGRRASRTEIIPGSYVMTAGRLGEWVIYHVDDETAVLVDWRQGSVERTVRNIPKADGNACKWVLGTCSDTNDRTVVGRVRQQTNGSLHDIRAKGFDDVEMSFLHEEKRSVMSVLRSADARTHATISCGTCEPPAFYVHKIISESEKKTWAGIFMPGFFNQLRIQGNVIEATAQRTFSSSRSEVRDIPKQQFVILKDDETTLQMWAPEVERGSQIVWTKLTSERGLAVVGIRSTGFVQVLKLLEVNVANPDLSETYREANVVEDPLHSWSIQGLTNLCVLADHVIVAMGAGGKLESFHFDRFCRGDGAYACPWKRALQSFCCPELS